MTDIALRFKEDKHYFDIETEDGDIARDEGLETKVALSLFLNRRADDDDDIPAGGDRGGWLGNQYLSRPNDQLGSRLWLALHRAKQTVQTLNEARAACEQALQWMIDEDVASSIEVETSYPKPGAISITVRIKRPGELAAQWQRTWERQLAK